MEMCLTLVEACELKCQVARARAEIAKHCAGIGPDIGDALVYARDEMDRAYQLLEDKTRPLIYEDE